MPLPSNVKLIPPERVQVILEDVPDLVLCKPYLIPLKTAKMEKLEKLIQKARDTQTASNEKTPQAQQQSENPAKL